MQEIVPYVEAGIDIVTGMGTTPSNPPQGVSADSDNRYCAAWDEVMPAIKALADAIDQVASVAGTDVSGLTNNARDLADKCKMLKNRGE